MELELLRKQTEQTCMQNFGCTLADASDMVTDAQSAFGLNMEQTKTMVDQMAKTAASSNTSVEQLGRGFLKIGATARQLRGGTQELSMMLGVLADNGIKGAEGGTHLRNMLLSLQKPSKDGAKALENMGIELYDTTDGKLRPMVDIFADLNEHMSDMSESERMTTLMNLFNKTDIAAANALLGTSAERFEELYRPGQSEPIVLDRMSSALHLVQHIRYGFIIPMPQHFIRNASED